MLAVTIDFRRCVGDSRVKGGKDYLFWRKDYFFYEFCIYERVYLSLCCHTLYIQGDNILPRICKYLQVSRYCHLPLKITHRVLAEYLHRGCRMTCRGASCFLSCSRTGVCHRGVTPDRTGRLGTPPSLSSPPETDASPEVHSYKTTIISHSDTCHAQL